GHALGLFDPALTDEDVGEQPLALAQRAAVLERHEHADGLPRELLRRPQLAAFGCDLAEPEDGATEVHVRAQLAEQAAGLIERRLGSIEISEPDLYVPGVREGVRTGHRAAALLGEHERAVDHLLCLGKPQLRGERLRELAGGLRLEIDPSEASGELEPFLDVALELVDLASPARQLRAHHEGAETVVRLEDAECTLGELPRTRKIAVAEQ